MKEVWGSPEKHNKYFLKMVDICIVDGPSPAITSPGVAPTLTLVPI